MAWHSVRFCVTVVSILDAHWMHQTEGRQDSASLEARMPQGL